MHETVRVLHLLAMAFFVGGQLIVAAALVPFLRAAPTRPLLRRIARRFAYGSLVALGVLAITGAIMADRFARWDEGALHVKLALVAATVGLILWHVARPGRHAIEAVVLLLSVAIVALGVTIAH